MKLPPQANSNRHAVTRTASLIFFSLLFAGAFFFAYRYQTEAVYERSDIPQVTAPDAFDGVVIEGKAAYVFDVRSAEPLYTYNAEAPLPLASLTKLMTALVARTELPASSTVVISERALATDGEYGLILGERWNLRDLSDFMLTVSSNDAAEALADAAVSAGGVSFTERMNAMAATVGLVRSSFENASGLDLSPGTAGAYGSARDVAGLLAYMLQTHPDILEATRNREVSVTSLSGFPHKVSNTNEIVNDIPGVLAGKTGFTDLAGGNLALAVDAGLNRPVVIVILGSSKEGRFSDMERLYAAAVREIRRRDILKKAAAPATL
jgi:serine-type D-Ala-D-Ala carboxypeptidase (penicillin-binding protein 5/6)